MNVTSVSNLNNVDDDNKIARYFSGQKLDLILDSQEVWFSNVEEFMDKRERSIPECCFLKRSEDEKSLRETIHKFKCKHYQAFISCWTEIKSENYALWKIYDKDADGACIITTVGKLKEQFKNNKGIISGRVEYLDFYGEKPCELPWVYFESYESLRATEFFKIEPYTYENEIRFVNYLREEEISNTKGFGIKVDLESLAEAVIISPFSSEETSERTKQKLLKVINKAKIMNSIIKEK